jgi:excisionase family DNA binding protein
MDWDDDLLTLLEVIELLRLDADGGDAKERLRNLIRRQGLPVIRAGRFVRFRRGDVEAWLEGKRRGRRPSKK